MYNIGIRRRYVFGFCIFGSVTSINIVSFGYRLGVNSHVCDDCEVLVELAIACGVTIVKLVIVRL